MWLILCGLLLISLRALWRLRAVRCAAKRLALADRMRGVRCDAPDQIGLSILATEGADREQVAHLLAVEYARYEVVVVLDGAREAERFAELCSIYHLIRVEYRPTGELPSAGVQGLYRSRKRRFRRLVLLDVTAGMVGRRDAAADVAAYDHLLLVGRGVWLRRGAIERLVVLLASAEDPNTPWRVVMGASALLCAREEVVAAGGFGRYPAWRRCRRLYAALLQRDPQQRGGRVVPDAVWWSVGLLVVGGLLLGGVTASLWPVVTVIVTGVWLGMAAKRMEQLLRF